MDPFIRTEFNYDMNLASDASGVECLDASMAKQSFAEEADINTIVRRFRISGELPTNVRMPSFDDYTGVTDFKSAMDALALANEAFDAMPADVRSRFHNDPQEFVAFCSDNSNLAEARKLGLVPPEEVVATVVAPQAAEPLRDAQGQFRTQTTAEKAAEAKAGTVST